MNLLSYLIARFKNNRKLPGSDDVHKKEHIATAIHRTKIFDMLTITNLNKKRSGVKGPNLLSIAKSI